MEQDNRHLKDSIRHNLNLDYQIALDYEEQTAVTLNKIMNNFVHQFKKYFSTHTFILHYNDDIFSLISYYILKNIQGVYHFDLKIFGSIKNTKKYIYKKKDKIGNFKKKRLKKVINLSSFHPIYYVKNLKDFSNKMDMSYSPINRFTIEQLQIICKFFDIEDTNIKRDLLDSTASIFKNNYNLISAISCQDVIKEKYGTLIPYKEIKLNGDESDFILFDEILNEEENYIYKYRIPSEADKVNFIKVNLNHYINARNAVSPPYNIICGNLKEE